MDFIKDIFIYVSIAYALVALSIILIGAIIYFYAKVKVGSKSKFKYKGKRLHLVKNTVGVLKASHLLLAVDFKTAIEDENKALGMEYVKPFNFSKLRENPVEDIDLSRALLIICEKKEILPNIFKYFIEEKNIVFDFEKDFDALSGLAYDIIQAFFFENYRKVLK
jgi:hypothetical protein